MKLVTRKNSKAADYEAMREEWQNLENDFAAEQGEPAGSREVVTVRGSKIEKNLKGMPEVLLVTVVNGEIVRQIVAVCEGEAGEYTTDYENIREAA